MTRMKRLVLAAMTLSWPIAAATTVIGVITAPGTFQLDDAQARGNGTLFEGTTVETGAAAGDLELSGGVSLRLGANARGRVFPEYLELQRGAAEIRNAAKYSVRTGTVYVTGSESGAVGRVQVLDDHRVVVTSVRGSLKVLNPAGVVLAMLPQGASFEFQAPSGASGATLIRGCPLNADSKVYMTDGTTRVIVELRGLPPVKSASHIEVTGSQIPNAKPSGRATQVVQVLTVKELAGKCEPGAVFATGTPDAGPAEAAGGAGSGSGAGASGAAKASLGVGTKTVLAGVAVSAAGLGSAVALTSGEDTPRTISK